MSLARAQPILALIRRAEAGRDGYDAIWNGIDRADRPTSPITRITVGELMQYQRSLIAKGYASTALGAYQFISSTLRSLVARSAVVGPGTAFSPRVQDILAYELMDEAGFGSFLAGRIDEREMARRLARIWAGLPDPDTGRSVYAGDGLNKHTVSTEEVMAALGEALSGPQAAKSSSGTHPTRDIEDAPQAPQTGGVWGIIAAIFAAILLLFRRKKQ